MQNWRASLKRQKPDHVIAVCLRHALVCLATVAGCANFAAAQGHFTETQQIRRAYQRVVEGRLSEAAEVLDSVSETDPLNLLVHYVADLSGFIRVLATEDPGEIEAYTQHHKSMLEAIRDGDPESPYFLFTQSELHLHAALLDFKFGRNLDAATGINRAFRLLKRNARKFVAFTPNLKNLGMLRAGVGTIPDEYRWAVKLVSSLEGTVPEGLADLRQAAREGEKRAVMQIPEIHFFYTISLLHFGGQPSDAWDYLQGLDMDPSTSPLTAFIYGNVAMKTGHNDDAIGILGHRAFHRDAMHLPYLDFMLGSALLYRTDPEADLAFLRFLASFQGENYIKEAYQKLAWHSLIHGDVDGYREYMNQCLKHGAARSDEDKYAQEEALTGRIPHASLLRARLLYDGGYYQEAARVLEGVNQHSLDDSDRLEYTYRMGRVYHALGQWESALTYYGQTIERGRDTPYYFACNAALQSGLLYESRGAHDKAAEQFRRCLSLHPEDYRASLHQKAKAGLSRLRSAD